MGFLSAENKKTAKITQQVAQKTKKKSSTVLPQVGLETLNPVPKVSQMSIEEIRAADAHLGLVDWLCWPPYVQRWSLESVYGALAGVSCLPSAVVENKENAQTTVQTLQKTKTPQIQTSDTRQLKRQLEPVDSLATDFSKFSAHESANSPASKPAVLLLPGITGSKEDFLYLLPLLAAEGFAVHSFDLPGQFESASVRPKNPDLNHSANSESKNPAPRTPAPRNPDSKIPRQKTPQSKHLRQSQKTRYDWEIFEDTLLAVLQRLGRTHVVGLSFAGVLAQKLALKHPELFASLTLMSTPPTTDNGFSQVPWIGWLAKYVSGKVIAWLMTRAIYWNVIPVDKARLQLVRYRLPRHDYGSIQDMLDLMLKIPFETAEIANLSIPKLWMFGRKDLWREQTMIEHATRIGATIRAYSTGHSPCETLPFQVTNDLISFYRQID